tara:strand:- start:17630 stop:18283 length:654 start_codon:yes stop_codon:yes gene_type:complete
MKVCTIILARGGSKGIPKKNILPLNGKPLIQYSIEASMNAGIQETFVSTDDSEIAKVSKDLGCTIIERPDEISGDEASSEEALLHFVDTSNASDKYDTIVFIQPTSPLIISEDLRCAMSLFEAEDFDSVFSVYREHWVPRWSLRGKPILWDMKERPRRQDVSDVFVENGAFYITKKKSLVKSGLRYSGKIGMYEMPQSRSFQIDTLDDVEIIKGLIS